MKEQKPEAGSQKSEENGAPVFPSDFRLLTSDFYHSAASAFIP
jgi:hypothetical protein